MCGRWDVRRACQLAYKQTRDAHKQTELGPIKRPRSGHDHHVPDVLSNAPDVPNEATRAQFLQSQLRANRKSYIIANFPHYKKIVVFRLVLWGKLGSVGRKLAR